ncbi:hypothetical protein I4U23_030775 [Adineta vaga]|nr:hypothetical protein I4U23_030775 [Adineta vaga]
MERTVEYVQSMSNFDSIYNAPLNVISQTPPYIPLISVVPFSVLPNRPTSPIFRRCVSPPSRQPILPPPGPKFNFDLYKTNESINDCCDGRISPSYRSLSPTSSNVIHHRSTYSPLSSPSNTRTYLKLREINDDLYQTLAQTEFNDPSTSAPHYHIHHYPVSQHSYPTYRSRSVHDKYSSSTELEMSPKLHQARVTYRVHFPSEHHQKQSQSRKSSRHRSPSPSSSSSDLSSNEEPIIIDLYPTKDQGFIEKERIRSDHRSPWIVDGTALRRNSYTDSSTSRSYKISKGLYYGDKPIKTRRRSNHDKEQLSSHRSSSSKKHERVWRPPSKSTSDRPPKYFEPTLKSERDMPTRVRSAIDGIESDQVSQRKTSSNQPHIRTSDPKFKRRIENAESKVKTAWEPTVTGLSQSPVKESKPPTSHLIKQTTFVTPPKSHAKPVPSEPSTPVKKPITVPPQPSTTASTGRSSVNDLPIKPMFESTPRDQSIAEKNNESVEDLFQNESHISEPADRKHESHSSLPTLPEQPRKPSTELPKSPGTKPDAEPSSAVKDNVSITGDNHDENQLKTSTC